jgi:hypothetical protein
VDIDPAEAVLLCIRIASGEVFWFDEMVRRLTPDEVVVREVTTSKSYSTVEGSASSRTESTRVELNVYIRARQAATDRLMKYSTQALSLGLEERRVRMAEQWGDLMGRLIRGVLDELELTPGQMQRAPEVVRQQLLLLEGGA